MSANAEPTLLKSDLFGSVWRDTDGTVRRDLRGARWWTRPIATWLARREARALAMLDDIDGVPDLVGFDGSILRRSWIPGEPMQVAKPVDRQYYRDALRLLIRLHRAGVVHNDLAKEPNWLVQADGKPGLVDFQIASVSRRRGRLFRVLAREDLRHLLKHKRTYCADQLTARQLAILDRPAWTARIWRATGKPVYLAITRGLLGWADREGAGDRML